MTLQLNMVVASVSFQPMEVVVTHQGESVKAIVQSLRVDLRNDDALHGSLQLVFTKQSEIDDAVALFKPDAQLVLIPGGVTTAE